MCPEGDGTAASEVPPGAGRYWDTMEVSKEFTRSARPWDFASPILSLLLPILEDARICGAETALRRKAEGLLLMAVVRCIDAALESAVERGKGALDGLKFKAGRIVGFSVFRHVVFDVNC